MALFEDVIVFASVGTSEELAPETQEGVTTLNCIMDGFSRQFGRQWHDTMDVEGSSVHVSGSVRASVHDNGGGSMPSHTS